jgi:hypothetical protein
MNKFAATAREAKSATEELLLDFYRNNIGLRQAMLALTDRGYTQGQAARMLRRVLQLVGCS